MSDPINSPPPPQQQIIWSAGPSAPKGQWITIPLPFVYNINIPDLPAEIVETKKKVSDGCTCKKCREFYPYAEPNQKDGTLVCYGCRMTW
jgi:hypothetical protein